MSRYDVRTADREEFLRRELHELTSAIKKAGGIALVQLRKQRSDLHQELDTLRADREAEEERLREKALAEAPPEELRARLRHRAKGLPLPVLEVFVEEYIDRNEGRVELVVHADRIPERSS